MKDGLKDFPKVSVIIPFFRHSEWLQEALQSVLNQDYQNFEIVLVDDGSEEDISEILSKCGKEIIYIRQDNKGAAAARNRGISASSGEYVAFLDSDDLWEKEKLSKQIKHMREGGFLWSHTDCVTFSEAEGNIKYISTKKFSGDIFPLPIISSYIATPSVIVKKSVLQDNEYGFEESIKTGEDSLLWLKLSEKNPIGQISEPLTKVRMHNDNAINDDFRQLEFRHYCYLIVQKDSSLWKKIGMLSRWGYKASEYAYFRHEKGNGFKSFLFQARVLWKLSMYKFVLIKR